MVKSEIVDYVKDTFLPMTLATPDTVIQKNVEKDKEFVTCLVCGEQKHTLAMHLQKCHGLDKERYLELFPGAEIVSENFRERCSKGMKDYYETPGAREKKSVEVNNLFEQHPEYWERGEEARLNMSKAHLGKPLGPHSEETKQKISKGVTRSYVVDPGLSVLRSESAKESWRNPIYREKQIKRLKGRDAPWMKTDKNPMKNPKIAKEVGAAAGRALKGRSRPNVSTGLKKYFALHPEVCLLQSEQASEWHRQNPEKSAQNLARARLFSNYSTSRCETAFHEILDELGVKWCRRMLDQLRNQGIYHVFDAVVEEYKGFGMEITFEVDGCWWHQCSEHCPNAAQKDIRVLHNVWRDQVVVAGCEEGDVPLYRFWEHDLLKNKEWVKQEVLRVLEEQRRKVVCNG